MKKITLLLLFALLIISCQNEKQNERLKSSLNFQQEQSQHFIVKSDSIISIKGKKGTKVTFNTNVLEGFNSTDSLVINLIELTTKQDLLLANTQTVSNGKWLISGGAFKIDIRANGESLTLKEGKMIKVDFPKTSEVDKMQLFYGKRDKNDNMNWLIAPQRFEEKKYYTLIYNDTDILDIERTSMFGGVETFKTIYVIDSLGYLSLEQLKKRFKINELKTNSDTLRIYKRSIITEIDESETFDALTDTTSVSIITKEEIDKLNSQKKYYSKINRVYKTIEILKLGWINIDKFAPKEEKVNIELTFSKKIDAFQTYIIDQQNNTILNVYNNKVEIPINRSFYIISFGLKDDAFYAYKKSVRFSENRKHIIEFKKVNEFQLKSILKLD